MVIWRDFSQKPMHCLGIVREWPGATLRLPIDCPCHRSAGFSVGSQRWISKGQERLEQLMFFCCKGMTKNDYYSVISISIIDYAQQTIMKASLVCLNHHEKQKHRYIIICFFLISICLIHVLHKTYVMNANFLGYFEPAKSWDVTFDSELSLRQKTPGASKTNSEFAPKDRPSSQNEMLVSQNTKLVRGCVFAFWFLTMLSWNGLKFTVLFTPLVCCSECSDNKTVVAKLNLCGMLYDNNFNFDFKEMKSWFRSGNTKRREDVTFAPRWDGKGLM